MESEEDDNTENNDNKTPEELNLEKAFGFFSTIDLDGDGFIDRIDVRRMIGFDVDESKVDDVMSFFTTDDDGKISFNSFYSKFDAFLAGGLDSSQSEEQEPEEEPEQEEEPKFRNKRRGNRSTSTKKDRNDNTNTLKTPANPTFKSLTLTRKESRKLSLMLDTSRARQNSDDNDSSTNSPGYQKPVSLSPRLDRYNTDISTHLQQRSPLTPKQLLNTNNTNSPKPQNEEQNSTAQADTKMELAFLQFKQDNELLENQIQVLTKKCNQWKEHGVALEEMNASFAERVESLTKDLEKKDDEIKEIKFYVENRNKDLGLSKDKEKGLHDQISTLNQLISDLNSRIQALEISKEALQLKNTELQGQVDELSSKENMTSKIDIRRKMTEMKSISHQMQVVRQLQAENKELKIIRDKYDSFQTQITAKDNEIEQLNHQVSALQFKISELEKQLLLYQQGREIIETPMPEPIHIPEPKPESSPLPQEPIIITKEVKVKDTPTLDWKTREECICYSKILNSLIPPSKELDGIIPIIFDGDVDEFEFFNKVTANGGLLLAKFINLIQPETIDERAISFSSLSSSIKQNFNLVLSAAKAIGVQTMELTAEELKNPQKHAEWILRFIASLVKTFFTNSISVQKYPFLFSTVPEEERSKLYKISAESLILKWLNWTIQQTGYKRKIENLGTDTSDGLSYIALLMYLFDPSFEFDEAVLSQKAIDSKVEESLTDCNPLFLGRAKQIFTLASNLNIDSQFFTPENLAHSNPRIHLLFLSKVFTATARQVEPPPQVVTKTPEVRNATPEKTVVAKRRAATVSLEQTNKEETVLRLWINSLEQKNIGYIQDLQEECKDGLLLLRLEELIEPKIVNWRKVERNTPLNRFKMLTNCNYAVDIASKLGCTIVGIGGTDIVDGNLKLITAIFWQLMRAHTLHEIKRLQKNLFATKNFVTDDDIINWANDRVKKKGKKTSMNSFKDPKLSSCLFFIDLLWTIDPRIINWDFVNEGRTREDRILNAKYALSTARKLGATVFVVPQDLVDVKQKMVQMFVSAILAVSKID